MAKKDLTQIFATGRLAKGNFGTPKKKDKVKPKTDKELASTRLGKGPQKETAPTASVIGNIAKAITARSNMKESKAAQAKRVAAVKRLKAKKK